MGAGRAVALAATIGLLALVPDAGATAPTTFDPVVEAENFSITQQRQAIYDTPEYQAQLADGSAEAA